MLEVLPGWDWGKAGQSSARRWSNKKLETCSGTATHCRCRGCFETWLLAYCLIIPHFIEVRWTWRPILQVMNGTLKFVSLEIESDWQWQTSNWQSAS